MKLLFLSLGCLAISMLLGCGPKEPDGERKLRVAYVGNAIAPFWTIAEKGARKAGEEFGVDVEVRMPANGASDQKRMVEELLARGVDGIAFSPADPANQLELMTEMAKQTILITQDSDAPDSPRRCFVGMDNYQAGRLCGKLVKEALPDGGKVMFFVGRAGQLNAKQRRQGVIDELLDRPVGSPGEDAADAVIEGGRYVILGTRTDEADVAKAKANVQDTLTRYPDVGCLVGLFSYNTPQIFAAVKEAGRVGAVKIVGFDEEDDTLRGVQEGAIHATVVQSPYRYGYESVRILAALAKGDNSVVPESKFLEVPAKAVKKEDVAVFWEELKALVK
ncbi:substrate-binding domain-containing protein [Phragmitibacter flavus]|uniref:Substrate-binding domain-containing protein n=1 Tax=Phragmitibacter flavus TaxID=2576071 RepID=A0A5R8KDA7_9BACT|nr:sugar-binding protein [Phragmitibacter flavus]TLD70273.1 substrate-binding domain-containing protein [Phragmitibacter flavus]